MCYIEVINFDSVNLGDPGSVWILFKDCFSHSTHTLLFRGSGSTDDSRVKETKNGSNFSEGRVLPNST